MGSGKGRTSMPLPRPLTVQGPKLAARSSRVRGVLVARAVRQRRIVVVSFIVDDDGVWIERWMEKGVCVCYWRDGDDAVLLIPPRLFQISSCPFHPNSSSPSSCAKHESSYLPTTKRVQDGKLYSKPHIRPSYSKMWKEQLPTFSHPDS
jgi:hypothetical protein